MGDQVDLVELARKLLTEPAIKVARDILFDAVERDRINPELFELLADSFLAEGNRKLAIANLNAAQNIASLLPGKEELAERVASRHAEIQQEVADAAKRAEIEARETARIEANRAEEMKSLSESDAFLESDRLAMKANDVGYHERHVFHPYFGFIQRPGMRGYHNNNYGFPFRGTCRDYPYNGETGDAFIVGIFGGSVPAQLCAEKHKTIETALAARPEIAGREIVILPFAQGGWEQPQQTIALAYFASIGQRFDLVVNMDGFNEAVGKRLNQIHGFHPAMPQYTVMKPLRMAYQPHRLGSGASFHMARLLKMRGRIDSLRRRASAGGFQRAVILPILRHYERTYAALSRRAPDVDFGDRDDILVLHKRKAIPLEDVLRDPSLEAGLLDEVVDIWRRSSILMSGICNGIGAKYLHVLQPNHYFGNHKPTEKELKDFYRPKSYPGGLTRATYPLMLAQADALTRAGVHFCDLSGAFDDEPETVMHDEICHFNERGQTRLAEKLIREIVALLK